MTVQSVECASCGTSFEAKTTRARYCGVTCRSRAARQRKAAEAGAAEESKTGTDAEHELVKAVRLELGEKAATFSGQLALQLARRLVDLSESGTTALSKELRSVMAEAKTSETKPEGPASDGPDSDGGPAADEDDEVTRARRQREEARQAAGLA